MKIVIVDDDKLVASALKTIVEMDGDITVCETGCSCDDAINLYRKFQPDVILMDIRMGEKTGLDAAEVILNEYAEAKVLFLTTFSDDEYISKALRIGAKGYILKQHFDNIVPALMAVNDGHNVFGDEVVAKLPDILSSKEKHNADEFGLTDKEVEIISLIAKGMSNKEIASSLFLSEGTVRNYISTVLEKLELRDRTQLVIFYYNSMK